MNGNCRALSRKFRVRTRCYEVAGKLQNRGDDAAIFLWVRLGLEGTPTYYVRIHEDVRLWCRGQQIAQVGIARLRRPPAVNSRGQANRCVIQRAAVNERGRRRGGRHVAIRGGCVLGKRQRYRWKRNRECSRSGNALEQRLQGYLTFVLAQASVELPLL